MKAIFFVFIFSFLVAYSILLLWKFDRKGKVNIIQKSTDVNNQLSSADFIPSEFFFLFTLSNNYLPHHIKTYQIFQSKKKEKIYKLKTSNKEIQTGLKHC